MNYIIPESILNILSQINNAGYKAHIVGGCLRDILINKEPTDWDITTNASPGTIKGLFKRTFDTGIKHGTVTVLYDNFAVEVTTWRKDSTYSDHRRPDAVIPTNSLEEDLSRRDFTVNAMAYHPEEGLVDPFDGLTDLKSKLIRCVGSPQARFSEDALRILRAIRFSAQLDFKIEEKTLQAIKELYRDILHISKERIQAEINKILLSDNPQMLNLLWETNINSIVFPKIKALSPGWNKALIHFMHSENQKDILLALLFYTSCIENPLTCASEYLSTYKYDNRTRRNVKSHIKCLEAIKPLTPRNVRKNAIEHGLVVTGNVIGILRALDDLSAFEEESYNTSIGQGVPKKLAVTGEDLKSTGLLGRDIKNMLDILWICIYENPDINNHEILMNLVRDIKSIKFSKKRVP
ncbi:MAG: CCA tRNA nucleotidyltransferase [Acetivibrionales bacterium]|jgi:tRNA nucleotidyltransferase (CCA-adding enzyme)|nr:CCA tRNA nucleotidyltransferase [Clostridiaceae bacterium]